MAVIGVKWVTNNTSSTLTRIGSDGTAGTYTGPATGGTAFNSYTGSVHGSMKRCNVWDDGSVTSSSGTRCYTDIDVSYIGQAMVQVPQYLSWIDTTTTANTIYYYMAPPSDIGKTVKYSGAWWASHTFAASDTHPMFLVDGVPVDYVYVSAFEGSTDAQGYYRSMAGVAPTYADSYVDARSMAEGRGSGWELLTIQVLAGLQQLFITEYATMNSDTLGYGIVGAGGLANTGSTGSTGTDRGNLSYGTTNNQTTAVSYRGIENLWGNMGATIDGISINSSRATWIAPQSRTRPTYYVWDTYAAPYVNQNHTIVDASSAGYITGITGTPKWAFLPNVLGGSDSTYLCDQTSSTNSQNLILVAGGDYNDGKTAGLFAQHFLTEDQQFGGRIIYLPST